MASKKGPTFNDYVDFLDNVFAEEDVAKLMRVSPLESFNEEIQAILQSLYGHSKGNAKRLGSIVNSVFTQQNGVFTLSVRIAQGVVKADSERTGLISCEPGAYNDIVHRALVNGIFQKIRDQVGKKAALYKLTHPQWCDALYRYAGKDVLDAKEHRFIEWWDSTNNDSESIKKPERVLTEEQKKAREVADAIFKRS